MCPDSKWILLIGTQLREGVVDMAVAGLVSTHRQQQISHCGVITKLPVIFCNVRHLQSNDKVKQKPTKKTCKACNLTLRMYTGCSISHIYHN